MNHWETEATKMEARKGMKMLDRIVAASIGIMVSEAGLVCVAMVLLGAAAYQVGAIGRKVFWLPVYSSPERGDTEKCEAINPLEDKCMWCDGFYLPCVDACIYVRNMGDLDMDGDVDLHDFQIMQTASRTGKGFAKRQSRMIVPY
jgi:hypothetical protein